MSAAQNNFRLCSSRHQMLLHHYAYSSVNWKRKGSNWYGNSLFSVLKFERGSLLPHYMREQGQPAENYAMWPKSPLNLHLLRTPTLATLQT